MNSHAGAVRDQLGRLFHRGTVSGLGEGTLLERYVADRDEAAFAALVARHGPMVLGVCRRVLRDDRDVEDAFQATFLVLVRRAGSIRDGDLLGRWLHGVAHRVAVRARAYSSRRFVREQSVGEPVEPRPDESASDAAGRRELATIVDEEVRRLPSTLRAPVVLCYLEGLSHDEAARRLGWPVGTVRSRMARRGILRHRLLRRGIVPDGAAIAASLARQSIPPAWLETTVRHSLDFAPQAAKVGTSIGSARSVALARRVLTTMILTNIRSIGAVGLGVVVLFGGVRTLAFQDRVAAEAGQSAAAARPQNAGQEAAPKHSLQVETGFSPEAALAWEISLKEWELLGKQKDIKDLTARIAALREMLTNRRPDAGPPRVEPKAPSPAERPANPPAPAGDTGDRGAPARPRYFYLEASTPGQERKIVVVSPDGSKVATFEPRTGKSAPLKLPAIDGVRREVIPQPYEVRRPHLPKQVNAAYTPWFFALDLDGRRRVTRIAAFDAQDGTWTESEIPEPIDRSSVTIHLGNVFRIGRRLYALSSQARRWGVLELPPGTDAEPYIHFESLMAEADGRLYRFDARTGNWEDLYAKTVGNEPAGRPR